MSLTPHLRCVVIGLALASAMTPVHAQKRTDAAASELESKLVALEANPDYANAAAYERLQARHAVDALGSARQSQYEAAYYVADRRVQIAVAAADTAAMQQRIRDLDRERSELLLEASRRDAATARAEAERLRIEAQVRAEEAERLRMQSQSDADAMADVETALKDVAGAQAARLKAAKAREAELARQEAELLRGAPSKPPKGKK